MSQNRKFDDVEAPVTVALLKVIIDMDWSEGEMKVTLSNLMKGLSIFGLSTTVQDVAGKSGKRKHHVPETATELLVYLKAFTNIRLYTISSNQCPLGHNMMSCIKVQRMPLMVRRGMDRKMLGAIVEES